MSNQLLFIITFLFAVISFLIIFQTKNIVNLAIISFIFIFLIPKETLFFIVSGTYLILFFLLNSSVRNGNKFIFVFFIFYGITFLLTGDGLTKQYLIGMVRVVGFQFLIVMVCTLFIRNYSDFDKLFKSLTVILFISYVIIGFYQYYTGSILSPWIEDSDIRVYTQSYDINRLRSFLDMHPANSANGILFVICLTIFGFVNKSKQQMVLFSAAFIALFFTFTRMSYIVLFIIILMFIYLVSQKKLSKIVLTSFVLMILAYPIIILVEDYMKASIRLGSEGNIYARMFIWESFFSNISEYIFGQGYFNAKRVLYFIRSSSENYFIQEFINYGIFSLALYYALFRKFYQNLRGYNELLDEKKKIIILMCLAFVLNMLTATYSQNMLFLVFGLSFAYRNVYFDVNKTMKKL